MSYPTTALSLLVDDQLLLERTQKLLTVTRTSWQHGYSTTAFHDGPRHLFKTQSIHTALLHAMGQELLLAIK